MTKQCSKCKLNLPLTEFFNSKRNIDGLFYKCKKCRYKAFILLRKKYKEKNKGRIYDEDYQKQCYKCKQILHFSKFNRNGTNKDGLEGRCRECGKIYQEKIKMKNKGRIYDEDYQKHCFNCKQILHFSKFNKSSIRVDGLNSYCRECSKKFDKIYYKNNKNKFNKYRRKMHRENKIKDLFHYSNGTMSCVKCGYSDIRALEIDHINNDGAEHRKKVGSSWDFYLRLIKNDYPEGYQVLCRNCNWLKNLDHRFGLS